VAVSFGHFLLRRDGRGDGRGFGGTRLRGGWDGDRGDYWMRRSAMSGWPCFGRGSGILCGVLIGWGGGDRAAVAAHRRRGSALFHLGVG